MVGCASPTSSAGHPGRRAPTRYALTFNPDHPKGAGQARDVELWIPDLGCAEASVCGQALGRVQVENPNELLELAGIP